MRIPSATPAEILTEEPDHFLDRRVLPVVPVSAELRCDIGFICEASDDRRHPRPYLAVGHEALTA